jgi:hypothetical protein
VLESVVATADVMVTRVPVEAAPPAPVAVAELAVVEAVVVTPALITPALEDVDEEVVATVAVIPADVVLVAAP